MTKFHRPTRCAQRCAIMLVPCLSAFPYRELITRQARVLLGERIHHGN